MNTPDISLAYKLALFVDRERGGRVLDQEGVLEEISVANDEYLSDVREFNMILRMFEDAVKDKNISAQDKELVRIKVYAMNLVTTFANLADELGELVKAYAFLDERK